MILLITLITFVMLVISGVSAESAIDASDISEVSISGDIGISNVGSNDLESVSSENVDIIDESDSVVVDDANTKNIIKDSGSSASSINVKVGYEYSNDANKISPDFYVVSEDGKYLNFTKSFDFNSKKWILSLNEALEGNYNITAMSAGYITESKMVSSSSLSDVSFDFRATEAYILGMTVAESADKILDFKNADDVLAVSTAGLAKLNNKTSEDALEAILNYGDIPYSNVLMLRQSAVDPIDFAFIIKKGNQLKAVIYQNGATTPVYTGTISENMTKKEWNAYYNAVEGENAWSFASLANGWAAGVSREILQEAAFHGHICEGTLGGYSIIQALMKYYPPVQENNPGSNQPAADITAYKVLGVPGGSDDDAALFFLDDTIGKTGYTGMNTTSTGVTENMMGFIRWYSATASEPAHGDLVIIAFNSSDVKKLFTKETGIDADAGSLEELQYNSWWIKQINTNPERLVQYLYEFSGLNQTHYDYLMGTTSATQSIDGEPFDYGMDGHGLDLEYILSLNLEKATRTNTDNAKATLSDDQLKQIGIDAAVLAKEIFKEELGVDIDRDDVDFTVCTDASYAFLNGQETVVVRDGLYEELGATLYSQTLLNLHQAIWKPLWFAFAMRYPDSDAVNMVYLRYNPATNDFFVGELDGKKVVDIGFETLNNSKKLRAIEKSFVPDGNWFNIQSLVNAWNEHPVYDQMSTFLYHAHVCPGVQPGFFMTDFILSNYPLGENESYTYIADTIYCKDDSLTYLLDLSPGLGNYFVQKLPTNETKGEGDGTGDNQGVLIVWDDQLKIGKAVVLSTTMASVDTSKYATSEASRAAMIRANIDLYNGRENPELIAAPNPGAHYEKWITEEQFNALKQGTASGANPIAFLKSLPDVTKEDLLKSMQSSNNTNDNSNSDNTNDGTSTNTNDGTDANSGSNAIGASSNNNNPTSSPYVRSRSAGVGTNGAIATAAPAEDASEDASEDADADTASEDAAYEVSKTPSTKSTDSNALAYAVVGVLAIGALLGLGYVRRNKK
ncbi:MAG: formylmethanofuran dehydrogenase [Methanobrevibacter sp.]|nr:formylmethanofuran dehydrogenase [Methanobrevibacter sp.]